MARADWTYELPPVGSPAEGLEEYLVESASGARVGKVKAVLRRGDELFVAVETGTPPLASEVRAIPWQNVDRVDHAALAVRLALEEHEVGETLELDPGRAVEPRPTESVDADAVRVVAGPGDGTPQAAPETVPGDAPRVSDTPTLPIAIGFVAVGLFTLLFLMILAVYVDMGWLWALTVVPAALVAVAFVLSFRAWKRPYERIGDRPGARG